MTQPVRPKIIDDPLYLLLREGRVAEFNSRRTHGENPDFSGCNFRGVDLRGANVLGINFEDAYFRGADLRGVDFRESNLRGASLATAHVSGCYFPDELSAEEIIMSLEHGTRLRYNG